MCWMLKEPLISPVQEPQRIPGLYVWIREPAPRFPWLLLLHTDVQLRQLTT